MNDSLEKDKRKKKTFSGKLKRQIDNIIDEQ